MATRGRFAGDGPAPAGPGAPMLGTTREAGEAQGLYVHVPFCAARCSYCAFATWTDRHQDMAAYFEALGREIEGRCAGARLDTVYFGGGTPSLPEPVLLAGALEAARGAANLAPGAEVTLEANPESVDAARAEAWLRSGFNRVSVGVQSFDGSVLRDAGRLHGPEGAPRAVAELRAAGFANLSLDLIAGLPGETDEILGRSVDAAIDLAPDHLSLYLLELDEAGKRTPLAEAVRAGRATVASADELADRYERTRRTLEAAGLEAYEISNFARPGFESRHNLKYWRCEPTLGCGVSAHWLSGGVRRFNLASLGAYLRAMAESGDAEAPESRRSAAEDLAPETVMLGLRLTAGVDLDDAGRHGPGARERFSPLLEPHVAAGLLERDAAGRRYRLTLRGALLSNEVFADVLGA